MVIRVGIIGLSAKATGTGWAASAHLPYLQKSPHYKIVALCNSSRGNAEAAIKAFGLSADTKAYGSPEELADDANVDLVVVNTRVDTHDTLLLPSLRKAKAAFCEWPLAANEARAKEMLEAAEKSGSRTMAGLQARASPVIQKIKKIIDDGTIGKVLSSTLYGYTHNGGAEESESVSYMTQREVGGNILTIHFGHTIDYLLYTLGEIETVQSLLATQFPEVKLVDSWATRKVVGVAKKNTPDQILLQAKLKTGALLSVHIQGGYPPPFDPKALWRIAGEKGDIEIAADSILLNVRTEGFPIRLHIRETGVVEDIAIEKNELDNLPMPARNIGRVYEAFAADDKSNSIASFQDAFRIHVLIESMLNNWDEGI
ncbi:NAD-P-binding protein [Microthyrium microscopicum]|uniref:NAD-P-binding protein n=1 Tax=Microthyrium microscopicum TaxID=703497 RepID=A0A6A6TYC8_9PEZI|nr:NAD-P-binding protein [Microthyrium microscopicum]